jgi:hypothetical protein
MPKVTIKRPDGAIIEADLSFEEFKQVAGLENHRPAASPALTPPAKKRGRPTVAAKERDLEGFLKAIGNNAKSFLKVLKAAPKGMEAGYLATAMGLHSPNQVGGVIGPMSRMADRFGVRAEDLYRSAVTFPNKKRTTMFYPGKLTLEMRSEEETPLFKRGA